MCKVVNDFLNCRETSKIQKIKAKVGFHFLGEWFVPKSSFLQAVSKGQDFFFVDRKSLSAAARDRMCWAGSAMLSIPTVWTL